jgi:predicted enzyme related to lactoylglutathione lyase
MTAVDALTALLREAGEAHHAAFEATDGHDPEWPIWYATFLQERLAALMGRPFTRSDLVRLLMGLEEMRAAEAPDAEWAPWAAARLSAWGAADPGADAAHPGVTGLGGVFFKARDPEVLRAWYREHLGIQPAADGSVMFQWREMDDAARVGATVWGPFDDDTTYFEPSDRPYMFNFRVRDLDALLARLRDAGVAVDDRVDDYPYGRFGWCMDPEGNRLELWEPR